MPRLPVSGLCLSVFLGLATPAPAQPDNLLRNGDFQDDWSTHLPELKNHHWNYSTEVYNRRDYNPDGWRLSGKWEWRDADNPRGQRKLVLSSPSRAVQSDDRRARSDRRARRSVPSSLLADCRICQADGRLASNGAVVAGAGSAQPRASDVVARAFVA